MRKQTARKQGPCGEEGLTEYYEQQEDEATVLAYYKSIHGKPAENLDVALDFWVANTSLRKQHYGHVKKVYA